MGQKLYDLRDEIKNRRTFGFFDDFDWYVTAHRWTSLVADTTPTVAWAAHATGKIALFTDTTDNNEVAASTTNAMFTFANQKNIYGEWRIQFTEGDTNKANVFCGFSSAAAANLLLDNGAGPAASMSALGIYKVDGSNVWKCVSQKGTTQNISTSLSTAGGSAWQVLGLLGEVVNSTEIECSFFLDGLPLMDATTNRRIKHTLTYTSAAAMKATSYCKTGGAAGGETLNVDYVGAYQLR